MSNKWLETVCQKNVSKSTRVTVKERKKKETKGETCKLLRHCFIRFSRVYCFICRLHDLFTITQSCHLSDISRLSYIFYRLSFRYDMKKSLVSSFIESSSIAIDFYCKDFFLFRIVNFNTVQYCLEAWNILIKFVKKYILSIY